MYWQYTPYVTWLLASALIAALLAFYGWQRRRVPGALPFVGLMLAAVAWSLANAAEMAGTDLPTKLFWANAQYLCYTAIPVGWLALILQYTGRGDWLTRRRLALLSIEPLVTVALAWTNDLHGLLRRNVRLDTAGLFPVIGKTFGPWFWIHAAYTYLLVAVSLYLLIHALWRARSVYRRQTLVLLIGCLLPLVSNALYNFGLSPIPRHDVSPAVLSVTGIIVAYGLFRYRLFDLVPVARDRIVEGMNDGVIVLDAQRRIVDINPAAQCILGWTASQVIGQPAAKVFASWPKLIELYQDEAITHTETAIESGGIQQFYDLHISPLTNRRGQFIGQVMVFRDITERKQVQAQLLQQQRALAVLEERDRLAREFHDSLGQTLGYVNVQAQAVRELLDQGRMAAAEASLARLATIAQAAHDDVREYILGVKGVTTTTQGLIPALEQYLRRFSQSYGLQTELVVPDDWGVEAFEPVVEVQLLRIIQEALTNVRKHANADSVRVTFTRHAGCAQVIVEDNGRGFDPVPHPGPLATSPPKPALRSPRPKGVGSKVEGLGGTEGGREGEREGAHFGLHIMRERAEEAGGSLQVQSAPGRGTKVIVQVPLRREKEEHDR